MLHIIILSVLKYMNEGDLVVWLFDILKSDFVNLQYSHGCFLNYIT